MTISPSFSDRILVIKLSALGDFVQALGPMKAIRDHHPDALITLLTTVPFADLAKATGWFDHVWADGRPDALNVAAWWGLRKRMNKAGFVRVYDLQTSSRSSFYYRALFGTKPEWSGVALGCSHPHTNPQRDFMHTMDRQREQLNSAGIDHVPAPSLDWAGKGLAKFPLADRIGLLVPGGAVHRPAKRWPAACYGEIAARFTEDGVQPVTIGAPGEEPLGHEINRYCPGALDLIGQTSLTDLAALAQRAEAAVGNDTGPMHMAAVTGCRTVVLFSADSDPKLCAPRGRRVTVLQQTELPDLPVAKVVEALGILGNETDGKSLA